MTDHHALYSSSPVESQTQRRARRVMRPGIAPAIALLCAGLAAEPSAQSADVAVTALDGTRLEGTLVRLAPELVLKTEQRELELNWSEVLELQPLQPATQPAPVPVQQPLRFSLSDGSRFGGRVESATERGFVIRFRAGQSATLARSNVESIIALPENPSAMHLLDTAAGDDRVEDVVVAAHNDRIVELRCEVLEIGAPGLRVRWRERDVDLPWSRFAGLVFARPSPAGAPAKITLRDHEVFAGRIVGGGSDAILLESSGLGRLSLSWELVERVECRSDRMVFLSDLRPVHFQFEPFFEKKWDFALDRTLSGQPIRLGGRVYAKGITMHSRSILTYALAGRFRQFAATIGIADEMNGRGDAGVQILGDGQTLWDLQRVRGGAAPQDIRVDITGVQRLDLVVDFGRDLDLSDHVCWAFARLIR